MERVSAKGGKTGYAYVHIGFEISLLLKGIAGLFEFLSGLAMLFINPPRLIRMTEYVTSHAFSNNPDSLIASELLSLSHSFSLSSQHFSIFYLASHGIVKCMIVYLLWQKKWWAYPLSIVVLVLFIITQMYRFTFTHSVMLVLLTVLDIVMIVLTYLEYRHLKLTRSRKVA